MKSRGFIITCILLLCLICILLIVFMIGMIRDNKHFSFLSFPHHVSKELIFDEVYDDSFQLIHVTAEAGDISIQHSNDSQVRVVVYGNREDVSIKNNNKQLIVESKAKGCRFFCINYRITKIEIYLPAEYDQKIDIQTNYGDIDIDDFSNATIEVDENCGDVKVIGGQSVKVSNDYGDISVEYANSVDLEENAGNVKVGTVKDAVIKNSYGNIEITKVENFLDVQNDCGDIKIKNINLKKDSYIENDLGDIKIGRTNEIYIDARVSLGDIRISNNYNKSDITLKIVNNCGDIKVQN